MRVIAVINQKGGVGKTTTTMNLSHALAQKGYRVLAVDFDPQANLTVGFGAQTQPQSGIGNLLLDKEKVQNPGQTIRENLELIPAGDRLGEFEYMTEGGASRGFLLQKLVKQQIWDKDFVLIDCAP
ncbi:MAG: ParA family protein, partial [Gammaproteobacteria bacterium]|nr:ParA family protein [Gammaproteobacteria bacterium]